MDATHPAASRRPPWQARSTPATEAIPPDVFARRWWEPRGLARRRLRRALQSRAESGFRLLFIAGCARSGTTLLRSLMPCFQGGLACPVERGLEAFLELAHGSAQPLEPPVLVVKRTHRFHRELHRLPACIDLVYCVRDPGDCLTSRHEQSAAVRPFHVTLDRWSAEYEGLLRLERRQPGRRIAFVRYEDLVTAPNRVQADLADRLGLAIGRSFSANGLGIAIHDASVGRARREPALLAAALAGLKTARLHGGSEPGLPSMTCGGPFCPSLSAASRSERFGGSHIPRMLDAFCRRFGYDTEWIGPPDRLRAPR